MQKPTLWTRDFTLLIVATVMGAVGGIAGSFALSFLVFDETGSTLASALVLAIQVVPHFLLPLLAAPWMDRFPRKPVLVATDAMNGVLYMLGGLYLLKYPFTYVGYLLFSLLLSSLGALDSLAYQSIYPKLIPHGMETKGYTVSSMLYSVLQVLIMPVAAILLDTLGVAVILMLQGGLSVAAAFVESHIHLAEESRMAGERFSFRLWWSDLKETLLYLRKEEGLRGIYGYVSMSNGLAQAYYPLLIAFFRVTPGFTTVMYSLFSVAEFGGRTVGGLLRYFREIKPEKRFRMAFAIYRFYDLMDACLLWLPYPLMLVNRVFCGFLGVQSGTMREAAMQQYIPDEMRARLNAFLGMLMMGAGCVLTLIIGALGEVLDYRICVTLCAIVSLAVCYLTIWRNRKGVDRIYRTQNPIETEDLAE